MSRRRFLTASCAATAAATLTGCSVLSAPPASPTAEGLGEYIDLASFRPRPRVRVLSAVIRHKPPYWLGWPGTSYDIEGHRISYAAAFSEAAQQVGVDLVEMPMPLESNEEVAAFARKVRDEKPDAVLVTLQHLGVWPWAEQIADAERPTIIFAPVGTAFTDHVRSLSRRTGVHVISSLEVTAVEQALRAVRAKRQFEETRLLVLAGEERKEVVLERLGTKVRHIPRRMLHETFECMPETKEARDIARRMARGAEKVVEPTRQDMLNSARSFMTAKHLMRAERSNAITSDCLGMVAMKTMPTPPCMGVSMFQDHGVTYGCEADVFGAMSLMVPSYLFDRPGFMNDPVPETVKNVLIAAHCVCGTRLNGFDKPPEPYLLRSHSESDIGVAVQVLWRVGQPVTLVRFLDPNQLIVDTGTVVGNVDTPPAGGCRTSVEVKMDRVEDVRDVLGFHQVVFYGNHRRDVEAFAQLCGINVVHSPEHAPRREEA